MPVKFGSAARFVTLAAALLTFVLGLFLLRLPRHWASLPLLVGASYMTVGQSIDVGPFHFSAIRILVAIGVLRVVIRGERIAGHCNTLDRLMIVWALWAVASSFLHKDIAATLVFRLGMAYDALGVYFLLRVFIPDLKSILSICKVMVLLLAPVALEMVKESMTGRNSFAALGGVPEVSEVRAGRTRAQGPFTHSILAGSVGAVCLPMAVVFWRKNRKLALLGLLSTAAIVYSSKSSGPIMTMMCGVFGLALWRVRHRLRLIRWGALLGIFALSMVMNAPVYYVLDRIDLTGSGPGWHRAELIAQTLKHFNEWWLAGTDYTRHWMAVGVPWSPDHTDITNHYIKMGVLGGLPLMMLFIAMVAVAFGAVGKALQASRSAPSEEGVLYWALGIYCLAMRLP